MTGRANRKIVRAAVVHIVLCGIVRVGATRAYATPAGCDDHIQAEVENLLSDEVTRVLYHWVTRGLMEGVSFVRHIEQPAGYLLFGSPDLVASLLSSGLPGLAGDVSTDVVVALARRALNDPRELARDIAGASYQIGLDAYRRNYSLYRLRRTRRLTRREAVQFYRDHYAQGLIVPSKALYSDIRTFEAGRGRLRSVDEKHGASLERQLRIAAGASGLDIAKAAMLVRQAMDHIERASKGLSHYPPYIAYQKSVTTLEGDYETSRFRVCSGSRQAQGGGAKKGPRGLRPVVAEGDVSHTLGSLKRGPPRSMAALLERLIADFRSRTRPDMLIGAAEASAFFSAATVSELMKERRKHESQYLRQWLPKCYSIDWRSLKLARLEQRQSKKGEFKPNRHSQPRLTFAKAYYSGLPNSPMYRVKLAVLSHNGRFWLTDHPKCRRSKRAGGPVASTESSLQTFCSWLVEGERMAGKTMPAPRLVEMRRRCATDNDILALARLGPVRLARFVATSTQATERMEECRAGRFARGPGGMGNRAKFSMLAFHEALVKPSRHVLPNQELCFQLGLELLQCVATAPCHSLRANRTSWRVSSCVGQASQIERVCGPTFM